MPQVASFLYRAAVFQLPRRMAVPQEAVVRCRWRRVLQRLVRAVRCRSQAANRRVAVVVLCASLLVLAQVTLVARFRFLLAHRRQRMASVAQSRLSAVLAVRLAVTLPFLAVKAALPRVVICS